MGILMNPSAFPTPARRVDWADYAKGFCIIMVVMMHSNASVEVAGWRDGFMHALAEFANPFRMPDFFMISGLFLTRVIDCDWRTYLDRKVVHFAYFYALWVTIQFALLAAAKHGWDPVFVAAHGWDYFAAAAAGYCPRAVQETEPSHSRRGDERARQRIRIFDRASIW
jgi:uncharacterized membrane protein YcfT